MASSPLRAPLLCVVVLFAVTEQEPLFLSQVAAVKSSEYFAMFSKVPPTVWYGPQSMGPVKCSPARSAGV